MSDEKKYVRRNVKFQAYNYHPEGLNIIIITIRTVISKDIINDLKFSVNAFQFAALCQNRYSL